MLFRRESSRGRAGQWRAVAVASKCKWWRAVGVVDAGDSEEQRQLEVGRQARQAGKQQ